ncbi:MAG: hypothetical protein IID07_00380 [Gemmatimonadetes bacterium]|nr:hypothetical protein [Gemmatimonadota bacterium]
MMLSMIALDDIRWPYPETGAISDAAKGRPPTSWPEKDGEHFEQPVRSAGPEEPALKPRVLVTGAGDPVRVFYAHTLPGAPATDWRRLEDHLATVGRRAAESADTFGAAEWGNFALTVWNTMI